MQLSIKHSPPGLCKMPVYRSSMVMVKVQLASKYESIVGLCDQEILRAQWVRDTAHVLRSRAFEKAWSAMPLSISLRLTIMANKFWTLPPLPFGALLSAIHAYIFDISSCAFPYACAHTHTLSQILQFGILPSIPSSHDEHTSMASKELWVENTGTTLAFPPLRIVVGVVEMSKILRQCRRWDCGSRHRLHSFTRKACFTFVPAHGWPWAYPLPQRPHQLHLFFHAISSPPCSLLVFYLH